LKSKLPVWLSFALLIVSFMLSGRTWDRLAFATFNEWAQQWPPVVWSCLTILGDTHVAVVLLVPCLWLRPPVLLNFWLALPLAGASIALVKNLIASPRPAGVLEAGSFHIIGPTLQYNSYPSGHTLTAFAIISLVLLAFRTPTVWFFGLCLGLGVALSRMAVGAHWPADVIAGAALGWLCGTLANQLGEHLRRRYLKLDSPRLIVFMAVIWLALSLFLFTVETAYPAADLLQWTIAAGASALSLLYLMQRAKTWRDAQKTY